MASKTETRDAALHTSTATFSDLGPAFTKAQTTLFPERSTSSYTPASSHVRDIAWSPYADCIAVADHKSLRVWKLDNISTRISTELKAQNPKISGPRSLSITNTLKCAFNPTKQSELASIGSDGMLRVWDVRARAHEQLVGTIDMGGSGLTMAWQPVDNNDIVVGRKDDTLVAVDRRTMSIKHKLQHPCRVDGVSFTNSGEAVLLALGNGRIAIARYPSFEEIDSWRAHASAAHVVQHSPRGTHIATGASDALVVVWDTQDFIAQRTFQDISPGPVRSVSWSYDGEYVVAGGDAPGENGLAVVQAETGETAATLKVPGPTPVVQFHPFRYILAYGGGDSSGMRVVGLGSQVL